MHQCDTETLIHCTEIWHFLSAQHQYVAVSFSGSAVGNVVVRCSVTCGATAVRFQVLVQGLLLYLRGCLQDQVKVYFPHSCCKVGWIQQVVAGSLSLGFPNCSEGADLSSCVISTILYEIWL